MNLYQCKNGHVFDLEKSAVCPTCKGQAVEPVNKLYPETWLDIKEAAQSEAVPKMTYAGPEARKRAIMLAISEFSAPGASPEPGSNPNAPAPECEAWDCSCGNTANTGNFCPECGKKRPEKPGTWACPACGCKGLTGKFCPECGTRRP